ncbi:MAG: hypothetical protein CFE36_06440 [Sphingomonadaceae bacterium PASS1]|nr:MAG: hypothetical protein CFE36_06440 [Sphingomonadaceae bacterium PASS1]
MIASLPFGPDICADKRRVVERRKTLNKTCDNHLPQGYDHDRDQTLPHVKGPLIANEALSQRDLW